MGLISTVIDAMTGVNISLPEQLKRETRGYGKDEAFGETGKR